MRERFGGGSCWINSGVQALFAPTAFKESLATLWSEMPSAVREQLYGLATGNVREVASPLIPHQARLAASFCLAHTAPRTEPFHLYLFADAFYVGAQDDAAELLARVLHPDQSPALTAALRGRMDQFLECLSATCRHKRPTEGEDFHSLQLPLRSGEGMVMQSVQEAVDSHMPAETVDLREPCPRCNTGNRFRKTHEVTSFPRVLVIYLNRWTGHRLEDAILQPIYANALIRFKGKTYAMCAVVSHLGPSPRGGHYVAVTRHTTGHGQWWLYDDDRRVIATDEQVSTLCTYQHWGAMQSYVLMYERVDTNS